MKTFETAITPQKQDTRIRWRRGILAGFLSEVAVISALSLVIGTLRFIVAPGLSSSAYGAFAEKASYFLAIPVAALSTFLVAFRAVRRLESAFVSNGVFVGVVGTLLTVGFLLTAAPEDRGMYIASFVARITAGYFAGLVASQASESVR